jgi:hypothetical protein
MKNIIILFRSDYFNGKKSTFVRGQTFSFLLLVQTCSGFYRTFYLMGTAALSPVVKRQGSEADLSPPTNAEIKKSWIYMSTPHTY